ncbi:right-handed parallel beta-helix repeat-containing protein [Salinirubellus salinus]|uniref:Right-handed parallel beta-helix repeat-containing protein n=1 Tax=Salinirubellus salinus TaxID=1364945 RepID=A0A9E7R4H7_9EURY|nr:right-handed parallel beta-helix repeat-containing protein [Salinirubellus salinus]UWM55634.1 right-handed parallel beta-helix repeat-containing protein [Salinirubellus salinus]
MTRRGTRGAVATLWLSLALIVALLGGVSVAVAPAAAADTSVDGRTITQCGTIDEAGSYELGGDLTVGNAASCLTVTAAGVTIDGAGHTVDGVDEDSPSYGLVVEPGADDVTVTDLTLHGWEQGLRVRGDGFTGQRLTATRNGEVGVAMFGTSDATLEDSTVTQNGDTGVYTTGASDTLLADLTVRSHGTAGIRIDSDGGGSVVRGGTIADSGQFGVRVTGGSGPHVDGTTVSATGADPNVDGDGVGVSTSAPGTVVEGVTVTGSTTHGVHVVGGDEAAGFEVRQVTARANGGTASASTGRCARRWRR